MGFQQNTNSSSQIDTNQYTATSPTTGLLSNDLGNPLPHESYIRFWPLAALWPDGRTDWPESVIACCGFQAAELCLRLVEDALNDTRIEAFPAQRIARFVGHLIDGLELTGELLRSTHLPASATTNQHNPVLSPGFEIVSRLNRTHVDQITSCFAFGMSRLAFRTGIEEQLREIRSQHGLPPLSAFEPSPDVPVMDYPTIVAADTVIGLRESVPCGPEDHLFSTAHQIAECWLHIVHHCLNAACALAERRRWTEGANALTNACSTLALASQSGQLLDLMTLSDYHPLRVRLRDGSGAQSRSAQRLATVTRAAAQPFWGALHAYDLSILDILDQPLAHLDLYHYLCALKNVGKQIQSFLFQHYLLALSVLGTHSLGSLGREIHTLVERAARPVFPEINQAHHGYVMLTNFRYGENSGSINLRNELTHNGNLYAISDLPSVCSPRIIEARIEDYFRYINERDVEAWVNLFDPVRGQMHDVPGTRPYLGKAHLRIFINAMFNAFTHMSGTHSKPLIDGNSASATWRFETVSYHGRPAAFDGREEFLFGQDGHILKATAYWHPPDVARQWENK